MKRRADERKTERKEGKNGRKKGVKAVTRKLLHTVGAEEASSLVAVRC